MKKFFKKNYIKIILIFVVIALDLITKYFFDYKDIPLIDGFIKIEYSHNYGASFSIMYGKTNLLIIITSIFLLAIMIYDIFVTINTKLYKIGIAFLIGGGLGNLIDRIFLGYVRDFIKAEFIDFPIFNIADSFLSIGLVILALSVIFYKTEKKEVGKQTKSVKTNNSSLDSVEESDSINNDFNKYEDYDNYGDEFK